MKTHAPAEQQIEAWYTWASKLTVDSFEQLIIILYFKSYYKLIRYELINYYK